ncbi:MAG: hypothetical protein ABIA75_03410 [Candidatus Neomarinimicrobiota bacterium]
MTDFQIGVQIVATSVMAITSIVIAWNALSMKSVIEENARRMENISEESIKIAAWEIRWNLFDTFRLWPIRVQKYLPSKEQAILFSGKEAADFINLNAIEMGSVIKRLKLVFNADQFIVLFLEKYQTMIEPLISLEIGGENKVEDVNKSLEQFLIWVSDEFFSKMEERMLKLMKFDF